MMKKQSLIPRSKKERKKKELENTEEDNKNNPSFTSSDYKYTKIYTLLTVRIDFRNHNGM